jgi:TP901 family phage tail tape measure protein
VGAQFGRAIGSAASKFPERIKRGAKEFEALEMAAREVGKTTEFTSVQAAKGLNFLAKAGFSAKFAMESLKSIVDFATASEIDFATAADIASDSLGAFGLDSDKPLEKMKGMNRVMDVLSKTANSTNVSVEELFESIKDGAAISDTSGASIETFSAMMGFLANSGIKASKAGTAAKNITLALAGVGNQAAAAFKQMGISIEGADKDLRDPLDVLDDLRAKLAGMGTAQKIPIISAIFGKIPIAAAAKLLDPAGVSVRGFRAELEKARGSTKVTAEFIRNDVKGSIDALSSSIEGVKISLFTLERGPLKGAIDGMTKWVRLTESDIVGGISDAISFLIVNFSTIVSWIKRIGIGIAVFITLATVLKALALVLTVVNLVLAANPITLIVIAIALLIAAVAAVIVWWEELVGVFLESGKAMDTIVVSIGLLTGPIGWLIAAAALIYKHWSPIKTFFADLWDGVVDIFNSALDRVMAIIGKIMNVAATIGSTVSDITGGAMDVVSDVTGSVSNFFTGDESTQGAQAQVVSPQERTARSIEEQRTTSTAEVVIKDDTGRAEIASGALGRGIQLQQTGAM